MRKMERRKGKRKTQRGRGKKKKTTRIEGRMLQKIGVLHGLRQSEGKGYGRVRRSVEGI